MGDGEIHNQIFLGDLIEGDEMGWSRDTQGTEDKCLMEFGGNTSKKEGVEEFMFRW